MTEVPEKSRGLGDTVAKLAQATGVYTLVHGIVQMTGLDCGCSARQELLNQMFPYSQPEERKPDESAD